MKGVIGAKGTQNDDGLVGTLQLQLTPYLKDAKIETLSYFICFLKLTIDY